MAKIDRRRFLAGAGGAAVLSAGLTGCTRSSEKSASGGGTGTLRWWDHFGPLQKLYDGAFTEYSRSDGGVPVEHTVYNASEMGQALQLAQKSNQMPDVFTNLIGVPDAALVSNGWVRPLQLDDAAKARVDTSTLIEGMHTFDGTLYSLPLFTARQHQTLTWFNRDLVEKAGGDPDRGPATWDEFRTLAKDITRGGTPGWVVGLSFIDRLGSHVLDLAQVAGQQLAFAGSGLNATTDPATGDYAYDSDAFVSAMEFLKSLVSDGSMLPASTSLDAKSARARWAAGGAGMFFDGPWNSGSIASQFPDFASTVGVGQVPTPDGTFQMSKGPAAGVFWVSKDSALGDQAGELIGRLTTSDFAKGLAEAMDQPPADLDVVASADVAPSYKRAVELLGEVDIAPSPIGKNTAVATVVASMQDVRPNLGEIAQGYLGGDVDDVRAALTDYTSKLSAERARAIDATVAAGTTVSLQDWIFPRYQPGQDYTAEQYS